MSVPTVAVICTASDQNGPPVAGAVYTAKLNSTEIYLGFVVPEMVKGTADVNGVCVLQLWPNALGVAGSLYDITATNPDTGKKFLKATVAVPNVGCNLHDILVQEPYPLLDAAAQALIAAQGYAVLANDDRLAAETAAAEALIRSAAAALSHYGTGLDKATTAADRAQTNLDFLATASDRVQTGLDRAATGQDRVQTGQDRSVTTSDREQTTQDKAGTGQDRIQTGLDRASAFDSRNASEVSATQALDRSTAAALSLYNTGLSEATTLAHKNAAGVSASAALAAATHLNTYIDSVVMNISFPLDLGLIADPVLYSTFDLGTL